MRLTVFFERRKRRGTGVHVCIVNRCLPFVQQIVKRADRLDIETGKYVVEGPVLPSQYPVENDGVLGTQILFFPFSDERLRDRVAA